MKNLMIAAGIMILMALVHRYRMMVIIKALIKIFY